METPRAPTQQHYDCLDGLRAVLALYVVMHHCWIGVFLSEAGKLSRAFMVLALGRYAVCFFIVLSGFCLVLPALQRDFQLTSGLGAFIRRRAWRILPPYYAALAISVLIDLPINHRSGTIWGMFLPVTKINLLSHVLLVHNFMPSHIYKINGAFWSIPIEWQIYFVFPLLLLGWRWIGPFGATAAALVFSPLLEIAINTEVERQPCLHFIGLFALGMLAAFIGTSTRFERVPWRLVALLPWAVFFSALVFSANDVTQDLSFGLVAAVTLIIMFLYPQGWLHRGLNWKPLVFIGSFSYSIYLMHAPLLITLWISLASCLDAHPNGVCLILLIVGTPVIVVLSYFFHLAFEKPFLVIRERKLVHVR